MKILAALGSVSASLELSSEYYFDERANRVFKTDNSSSYEPRYFEKYRENIENASFSCVAATIDETTFHGEPWDASSNDGDKCIYLIDADKTKRSWADAQAVCEASVIGCPTCRGSLLTVHTQFQDNRLYDLVVASQGVNFHPFWLGARKYCTNCQFEYSDHTPFDFTNWTPGEPNNWGDGEECVEVSNIWGAASYEDGYWNDNNCNSAFFYVCQAYKHEQPKIPNGDEKWPLQGYCKAGWKKFGRACFKILGAQIDDPDHQIQSTFEEAKTRCGQESVGGWSGATLAIFPNVYYNHFATALSKNLGAQKSFWIGALSSTQDMTFHWVDESRMTFTSWLPGEPNGQPNGENDPEDFVEMLWTGGNNGFGQYFPGQWNDLFGSRKLPFMCSHTLRK